ncbi:NAD(P)-binding protein [Hypoxylon sp. FL1284]|nr:NAD(P)-binding protein [Hypoxylon sp. FL1284]
MASRTTKQWILAAKPTGAPVRYFSNDTGLRNFIQSTVAPERFYVPPVPVGAPMRSGLIAEVLESAAPDRKPGDLVMDFHLGTWSELVVLDSATAQALAPLPNGLPLTHYLGAFGASGLAAYTGLARAGGVKRGDTVVISAAAGATGSMAVQIAARLLGAGRVVGIAGSDAKCAWVRDELGADACVNYRSPTFAADLAATTPGAAVDVYFDNVGGAVLDAVLTRMRKGGTVAVCGAVSAYNEDAEAKPMALRNWFEVVSMRITIRGFIMLDYLDEAPAILKELVTAAGDGRIKLGSGETVVEAPIEKQPEVWMSLFTGANQGKLLTKLIV